MKITSEEKKSTVCYVIATETWPYLFACESLGITFLPVDFCGETGLEFVLTHSVCLRGCVRLYFFFCHPHSCDKASFSFERAEVNFSWFEFIFK